MRRRKRRLRPSVRTHASVNTRRIKKKRRRKKGQKSTTIRPSLISLRQVPFRTFQICGEAVISRASSKADMRIWLTTLSLTPKKKLAKLKSEEGAATREQNAQKEAQAAAERANARERQHKADQEKEEAKKGAKEHHDQAVTDKLSTGAVPNLSDMWRGGDIPGFEQGGYANMADDPLTDAEKEVADAELNVANDPKSESAKHALA